MSTLFPWRSCKKAAYRVPQGPLSLSHLFALHTLSRYPLLFACPHALLYPWGKHCHHCVCKRIGDIAAWNMSIAKCTIHKDAPPKDVSPTDKRASIVHIFWDRWQVSDLFICRIGPQHNRLSWPRFLGACHLPMADDSFHPRHYFPFFWELIPWHHPRSCSALGCLYSRPRPHQIPPGRGPQLSG